MRPVAAALRTHASRRIATLARRLRIELATRAGVSEAQHLAIQSYDNRVTAIAGLETTIQRERAALEQRLGSRRSAPS